MTETQENKSVKAEDARQQLIEAANPDSEDALDDADAIYAAGYLKVLRNRDILSSEAPIENFIANLVMKYVWSEKPLTPEDIESEVKELKADFESWRSMARTFSSQYPQLMAEEEEE